MQLQDKRPLLQNASPLLEGKLLLLQDIKQLLQQKYAIIRARLDTNAAAGEANIAEKCEFTDAKEATTDARAIVIE
jgi:hypothetical protein